MTTSHDILTRDVDFSKPVTWGCPWHGELKTYVVEIPTPTTSFGYFISAVDAANTRSTAVRFFTRTSRRTRAVRYFIPMSFMRILVPAGVAITASAGRFFTPGGFEVYYWAALGRYFRYYAEQMKLYTGIAFQLHDVSGGVVNIGILQDKPTSQYYTDLALGPDGAFYIPHVDTIPGTAWADNSNFPLNKSVFFCCGGTHDTGQRIDAPTTFSLIKYENPVLSAAGQARAAPLAATLAANGMSLPPYALSMRALVDTTYFRRLGNLQRTREFVLATNPYNGEVWKIQLPTYTSVPEEFTCTNLHRTFSDGSPIVVSVPVTDINVLLGYVAAARPVIRPNTGSPITLSPADLLLYDSKADGSQFIFGLASTGSSGDYANTLLPNTLYGELEYVSQTLDPVSQVQLSVVFTGLGFHAYSFVLGTTMFSQGNPNTISVSTSVLYDMANTLQAAASDVSVGFTQIGGIWAIEATTQSVTEVYPVIGSSSDFWTLTFNKLTYGHVVTGNPPSGSVTRTVSETITRVATMAFNSAGAPTPLVLTYSNTQITTNTYERTDYGPGATAWIATGEVPSSSGIPHNFIVTADHTNSGYSQVVFELITTEQINTNFDVTWGASSQPYHASTFNKSYDGVFYRSSNVNSTSDPFPASHTSYGTFTDYTGTPMDSGGYIAASQSSMKRFGQNNAAADRMVVSDVHIIPKVVNDTQAGVAVQEFQYLTLVSCGHRAVMLTTQGGLSRSSAHSVPDNLVRYDAILTPDGVGSTAGFEGEFPYIFHQLNPATLQFNTTADFVPQSHI